VNAGARRAKPPNASTAGLFHCRTWRSLDHLVDRNQKRVWDNQAAARALIRAAHATETQGFGLAGIDRVQVSETKVSFLQVTRASTPNHKRIITNPAATPTARAV
jgi:hypothetical protein